MSDLDISSYRLDGMLLDDAHGTVPTVCSSLPENSSQVLPRVDLRKYCSKVEDQGRTGSCVANAVVGALELLENKAGRSPRDLSRAFLYYNARKQHHEVITDSGTSLKAAMAALIVHGICEERMWPLDPLTVNDPPTQACYENAQLYGGVEFARLDGKAPVTHILSAGLPVVIAGTFPREAYLAAKLTGLMTVPDDWNPATATSGHAMLLVGYDLAEKLYIVRNSWGEKFAEGGYFMAPFSVIEKCGRDHFWAIGGIKDAPGLELFGHSVAAGTENMVAQALKTSVELQQQQDPGRELRDDLQRRVDEARRGFASRLRGGQ